MGLKSYLLDQQVKQILANQALILANQQKILAQGATIMSDIATLESKITELSTALAAEKARNATLISGLQAALSAAQQNAGVIPDADIASLQAMIDGANADNPAPPASGETPIGS